MATEPVVPALLQGQGLRKAFRPLRMGLRPSYPKWEAAASVQALDEVSLTVREGDILAIVGRSGSGKSTLARALTMLDPPDAGQVWFEGCDLTRMDRRSLRVVLPRLQLLFQDSGTSFNPRFNVGDAVAEPLVIRGHERLPQQRARVEGLLTDVGLRPEMTSRPVHSLSGGQKQRLAIARALAAAPRVMVFDETFSGLDLSVRAQMLALLLDLKPRHGLTFILITHDLDLAAGFATEIAVMQDGKIVELGPVAQVLAGPAHIHTRQLVQATRALQTGEAWE